MIKTPDITNRIQFDFGEYAKEANRLIEKEILSNTDLRCSEMFNSNSDRIVRCIVYLANKNIDNLKKYIKAAKEDPRDIMFWAEYINHNEKKPLHVRDFSKAFDFK